MRDSIAIKKESIEKLIKISINRANELHNILYKGHYTPCDKSGMLTRAGMYDEYDHIRKTLEILNVADWQGQSRIYTSKVDILE